MVPSFTALDGTLREGDVQYVGYNNLVLSINRLTGEVVLENRSGFEVAIDAYTVRSASGALLPDDGDWTSLADQAADGGAWDEANADPTPVSETRPLGAALLSPTDGYSLGRLYDLASGAEDLEFEFLIDGDSVPFAGDVVYESPGDYNDDGVVDARDYVVWRDNLGTHNVLPGDTSPGEVTAEDFAVWRANYGAGLAGGGDEASAAPEPHSLLLGVILLGLSAKGSPMARNTNLH